MNLENFRKDYLKVITESTVDANLRKYVRSVVEDTLTEGVKSKDYNVSKKHNIHAGNYPLILNAVNTQSGKKKLSINMSAKESDLDRMENALQKVLDNLKKLTKDTLGEGVQSKNYNVSEKHTISAGNYPFILKAVNTLSGKNKLSLKMSAKESDLDRMENALEKNPKDETVLSKLRSRLTEAHDGDLFADTYPGPIPFTIAALEKVTGYDSNDVNILDMIGGSSEEMMDFNLDEIEVALKTLSNKISKEKYNDFIDGDEDDQEQILFDYKSITNLDDASKFLNWAVNT